MASLEDCLVWTIESINQIHIDQCQERTHIVHAYRDVWVVSTTWVQSRCLNGISLHSLKITCTQIVTPPLLITIMNSRDRIHIEHIIISFH